MSAPTTIERALLGAAYVEDVPLRSLRGEVVCVRVLSPLELSALDVALEDVRESSSGEAERVTFTRVLSAACSMPDGGRAFESPVDVGTLPPDAVRELWRAYVRAHERTYEITSTFRAELDHEAGLDRRGIDQIRARHASQLVAYFGLRSAREATPAQVIWFWGLVRSR